MLYILVNEIYNIKPDLQIRKKGGYHEKQYDVVIIGAGVVGSAIARELSRYKLSIAVLEKIWMSATRPVAATLRWCTAALPTPLAA